MYTTWISCVEPSSPSPPLFPFPFPFFSFNDYEYFLIQGVADQWKRRAIVTVDGGEDSLPASAVGPTPPHLSKSFPCITKRLETAGTNLAEVVELSPLEVAIEEITGKVGSLKKVLKAAPIDMKMLQMQIQGCVSTAVNAGPLEYAAVFFGKKNSVRIFFFFASALLLHTVFCSYVVLGVYVGPLAI